MQKPKIKNLLVDEQQGVIYCVMAYRKLADAELMACIKSALAEMKKSERPRRGQTLTLITAIGAIQ